MPDAVCASGRFAVLPFARPAGYAGVGCAAGVAAIRFFGGLAHAPVLLDDPEVTQSARVTHLRFRVRHRNA